MKGVLLKFLLLLFCLLLEVNCQGNNAPVITIQDGLIRGKTVQTSVNGKTFSYHVFRGIPYAKPPIGDLRFKAPVRNEKWNGTLNATEDKQECTQFQDRVVGSEDCLYINVYTPSLNVTGYAVMVHFYGGAFITGNSSYGDFGPDYLLEENVIFVSFNYRLGPFGFLSTEDLECPGNMGLKDQVLALTWVRNNIKYFGGDPNRVTIFGVSAGSASISYILQSESAKGLFKAAIMESGNSLCLWALNRRARRIAFAIGQQLGINTTNSTELIQNLRQVNYSRLQEVALNVSLAITVENFLVSLLFAPVIEPYHKGAFFTGYSDELLRRGRFHRVPVLLGYNSNEAGGLNLNIPEASLLVSSYFSDPEKLVPADLTNVNTSIALAGEEIKSYYLSANFSSNEQGITQFLNDDLFNRPIRRMVIDTMTFTNAYFYVFSYEGPLGGIVNRTFSGVSHGEEVGYLSKTKFSVNASQSDILTVKRMVRLFTNFAKYKNPTPTEDPLLQNVIWYPANRLPRNLIYLNIDKDLELSLNPYNAEMQFWDRIYQKYGKPPYNTY